MTKHNCQFKLSLSVLYTLLSSSFIYYPGDFPSFFTHTIHIIFCCCCCCCAVSFNLPHILLFHLYCHKISPHTIWYLYKHKSGGSIYIFITNFLHCMYIKVYISSLNRVVVIRFYAWNGSMHRLWLNWIENIFELSFYKCGIYIHTLSCWPCGPKKLCTAQEGFSFLFFSIILNKTASHSEVCKHFHCCYCGSFATQTSSFSISFPFFSLLHHHK